YESSENGSLYGERHSTMLIEPNRIRYEHVVGGIGSEWLTIDPSGISRFGQGSNLFGDFSLSGNPGGGGMLSSSQLDIRSHSYLNIYATKLTVSAPIHGLTGQMFRGDDSWLLINEKGDYSGGVYFA